jgi:hypothetical protein
MQIFRELNISAEPDQMAAIADQIEQSLPVGWARDPIAESMVRSAPVLNPRPTYCFGCSQEGQRPEALLFLTQKEPEKFSVSNILPITKHQLTTGEYNAILEDFYERVIKPHTKPGVMTARLSSNQADLEHWLSPDTAELLRQFSASANKGTGSAHPADRDRWNAFVLSAHRGGSKMGASELRRWLIEIDGWAREVADQLAVEYEYGRQLLAFTDGHRRSA